MLTLYPNEKIVLEKRKFWLPIALQGVVSACIAIAPFFILLGFKEFTVPTFQKYVDLVQARALFFSAVWTLIVWIVFFVRWTDYYLDVFLVTNKRVLDIEQLGLFSRDISETRLENIEDMRVEVMGFLASTLDFGNLFIQTAGAQDEFAIKNIPQPTHAKDVISHECELLEAEKKVIVVNQPPPAQPPTPPPAAQPPAQPPAVGL